MGPRAAFATVVEARAYSPTDGAISWDTLTKPLDRPARRGEVERCPHEAVGVDALIHLLDEGPRDERRDLPPEVVVAELETGQARGAAAQPADLEDVPEASGGEQAGPGGAPRQQGVQSHRGAVAEAGDLRAELRDIEPDGPGREMDGVDDAGDDVRGGRRLADPGLPVRGAQPEVGERAADVGADRPGGRCR
jgi:hypothetical protein